MNQPLVLASRLMVAADYGLPSDQLPEWVENQILHLADKIADRKVILKVNSGLRLCGYGLIEKIHDRGLKCFADLKLCDIPETLELDGRILSRFHPEFLTVTCAAGVNAMSALRTIMCPETEILGVTILTNFDDESAEEMYGADTMAVVEKMARFAEKADLHGVIASPAEAAMLRDDVLPDHMSINTPAVRFADRRVANDDQNQARVKTPKMAIKAGADRIVMGRHITQADNPLAAVDRALEEIEEALEEIKTR